MLVLLKLIDEIIYHGASIGAILKKSLPMLLTGICGMALYSLILKLSLSISSAELLDYQGISSSASMSAINLRDSLYVIKKTFLDCFFDLSKGINVYIVLNALVFLFTLAHYIKNAVNLKNVLNIFLVAILGLFLIFGAGALAFINAGIDYHNLMLMGYSVFYIFFIILYERGRDDAIKCWAVLLIGLGIIANQVVISNVSYHKAQMAYERSYGVLIRIADRIEQTPGAENAEKILVLGALENSRDYSVNLTPDITGITDGYIIRADDETVGQSVLTAALADYCEKDYKFISGEEKKNLSQREDIKSMEKWPSKTSVAVIDEIVVIKLDAEGEN